MKKKTSTLDMFENIENKKTYTKKEKHKQTNETKINETTIVKLGSRYMSKKIKKIANTRSESISNPPFKIVAVNKSTSYLQLIANLDVLVD